jgi:hypothetical protein
LLLPTLFEAKVSCPGLDFAIAITSPSVFAGKPGLTSSTFDTLATIVTGAKSLMGSNGSVLNNDALMACVCAFPNAMV